MACADVDMNIHLGEDDLVRERQTEQIRTYAASKLQPVTMEGPLHRLLQKQPAVLGSLQMMSGFFSVGVGIIFCVTQNMGQSLFNLFRLSHLTGLVFIFAGLGSNLLFKYPALLPVCLMANYGCITVAAVAVCLIIVDLVLWDVDRDLHLRIEVMELSVLVIELLLSGLLCFMFCKERRSHAPRQA
ncbi:uncharacterized protein LOC143003206 [Genypterus blacodes]|uniref:uncharacterized protein LOC143003206 n=1 Tax=Genypterus blacodes TaxID=154954 RepID=UPI003F76CC34